jgi:hypothetical protein
MSVPTAVLEKLSSTMKKLLIAHQEKIEAETRLKKFLNSQSVGNSDIGDVEDSDEFWNIHSEDSKLLMAQCLSNENVEEPDLIEHMEVVLCSGLCSEVALKEVMLMSTNVDQIRVETMKWKKKGSCDFLSKGFNLPASSTLHNHLSSGANNPDCVLYSQIMSSMRGCPRSAKRWRGLWLLI